MTDDELIGFFRAISTDVGALRDEVRVMSVRLEKVENDLAEFRAEMNTFRTEATARLTKIERKVEIVHKDWLDLRADQVGLESRVEELEAKPQ